MLIVHHLQRSQSERIVWLCEELKIPYELKTYRRDQKTLLAPPEVKALHPTGAAPVIQDGPVLLAESGAIMEYILVKYGKGKLVISPEDPNFADYLYWLHFANGHCQPSVSQSMIVHMAGIDESSPVKDFVDRRRGNSLQMLDERLSKNTWLAGEEFTAADIMTVFSLSTMRLFAPFDLEGREGILAWFKRVGERHGYKKAMEKGDPGFVPIFGAAAPEPMKRY